MINGSWEEGDFNEFESTSAWKRIDDERYIFSCEIGENEYAVWEVLWTIDIANKLGIPQYTEEEKKRSFSLHILIYSIGAFPGQPDSLLHIGTDDFQFDGIVRRKHLTYYDRDPDDEIQYNEELYLLAAPRIDSVLKGVQRGLPLHMTLEQVDILSTHRYLRGPILLSGEAGSGKTTIITHWLLINQMENIEPQLFVTFSDRLTQRTKQEFLSMLPSEFATHGVRFLTYRALLKEIASAGSLTERDIEKEMTFERYLREYSYRISSQRVDPVLLWDEIRSVIKGSSFDPSTRIIDYSTYEELSESRGRCKTPYELREDYYLEAQSYQNYLDKEGLWDGIDLAFDCLSSVNRIEPFLKVACDEVQDLAPIEIHVLINIVEGRNIDNIFFTGDTAQVINPSGFSWRKLKGDLGSVAKRYDIRDAWALRRNFRSSNEIVSLVNQMIKVREGILGDVSEKNIQHSYIQSGILPMVLENSPLDELKSFISNPEKRLILVKNPEMKKNAISSLGSSAEMVTILTIEEAKGLEWEGVLLWNFFIPRHEIITKNDWENIFIPAKRKVFPEHIKQKKKNPYSLAYEFNLLHVGLTRARKFLFIYDDDDVMKITSLCDDDSSKLLSNIDLPQFNALWETQLPEPIEIYDLAQKLIERDRDQAYQFFSIAAREYEKEDGMEEAANCYRQANEYKLAASCYQKAGILAKEYMMLAIDAEKNNQWKEAGIEWTKYSRNCLENGEISDAVNGFDNAGRSYIKSEVYQKAAEVFEEKAKSISKLDNIKYRIISAEALQHASSYWDKGKKSDNAIRTMKRAINIGRDDIMNKDESVKIGNEMASLWIANCCSELSRLYQQLSKIKSAAQFSLESGRYYQIAAISTEHTIERRNYYDHQRGQLENVVGFYMELDENDNAINVQKDIVGLLSGQQDNYHLPQSWEKLISLLRTAESVEEYITQSKEYMEYLRKINEIDRCNNHARSEIEWCKKNNFNEHALDLLSILRTYHEKDEEYYQLAKVMDEIGRTQTNIGESREAISTFLFAGKNYLINGYLDSAIKSFTNGKDLAMVEMTSSSVGWYIFKDVAIDSLLNYYDDTAKQWLEDAVDLFINEYDSSVNRLRRFIKIREGKITGLMKELEYEQVLKDTLKIRLINNRIQENKKILGWSWFCLASLHHKGISEGEAPIGDRDRMIDAYDRSINNFDELHDNKYRDHVKARKIESVKT